jgi:acyl-homoserine-lactone acylase
VNDQSVSATTKLFGSITASVVFAGQALAAPQAEIRTTSYGVPHVLADDFEGVGFGLGYAFANTDLCEIATRWVTVNAERSKYFGADEPSADAYA